MRLAATNASFPRRRALLLAWSAVFVLGAALLIAPWLGHFDDTDAQVYQVVIRKMAERRNWFDPAYLDHFAPHFREHLPFGLWPFVVAEIGFGEHGPPFLAAFFSVATLAGVAFVGRRLIGEWPAMAAVLVLGTTETFFRYGAETRLDSLLILLANGAALPALMGTKRASHWIVGGVLAALAAAVKGPFGLVPLVAAAGARAVLERSMMPLARGCIVAFVATLPVLGFLLIDRLSIHAGWWELYAQGQLLASATALRQDGALYWWFPFATIGGRFWPGLALIACLVVECAVQRRLSDAVVSLGTFCLFLLIELCVPGRKVWNHALVAYPGLALLAGAAILPASRWLEAGQHPQRVAAALIGLACVCLLATPTIGRAIDRNQCVGSLEFRDALDALNSGEGILLVSSPTSWRMLANLAAERRLEPQPVEALPPASNSFPKFAIVQEDLLPPTASGWKLIRSARGRLLLLRTNSSPR